LKYISVAHNTSVILLLCDRPFLNEAVIFYFTYDRATWNADAV